MNDATYIFMMLFLMLGPFKIIGPFTKLTRGEDPALVQKVSIRAILFSCLALLLAGLLGERLLGNFGIPVPILSMSGGIILFLVAILNVIQQFNLHSATEEDRTPLTINMAMYPLAFPTIVTPYGIAAVIVFLALTPDLNGKLKLGAIVLAIMILNLAMMLLNRYIFKLMAIILPVLGAILSLIQVALGLQIIYKSIHTLLEG